MNESDYKHLRFLADRDRWDVEILWARIGIGLTLQVLERFDREGWIEFRQVGIACTSLSSPRTTPGEWFSPTSWAESIRKFFPADEAEREALRRNGVEWRARLDRPFGLQGGQTLTQAQIFQLDQMTPVELRVSTLGRSALSDHFLWRESLPPK